MIKEYVNCWKKVLVNPTLGLNDDEISTYKVRLTKISKNKNDFCTDVVTGETSTLPKVGESFVLIGKPLVPGMGFIRRVNTSVVQNIEVLGNEYLFKTLNSTYKLEILDKEQ